MTFPGLHPFNGRLSRFLSTSHPEDAYLSYYDVRLTRQDVNMVEDDWFTDNIISFYEEWLEHERLRDFPTAKITLLRPSMTSLLVNTQDPLSLREALPDFRTVTHIFLPINDSRALTQSGGGSHWSLLVVSTIDGVAFHYDSLLPSPTWQNARIASQQLSALLGRQLKFWDITDAPRQNNGMDCGVFVCLEMKFLLTRRLLLKESSEKVNMGMAGLEVDARRGRRDISKLIERYRKEGIRSRSRGSSPFTRRSWDARAPPRIGD